MSKTNISWADETVNPVMGCTTKSAGCNHCYAELMSFRLEKMGQRDYQGLTKKLPSGRIIWTNKVVTNIEKMSGIINNKSPRIYFINSMGDLFHEKVSFDFIDKVFVYMMLAPQHIHIILTKRADRQREYMEQLVNRKRKICESAREIFGRALESILLAKMLEETPIPHNIVNGVSIENQSSANERVIELINTPAYTRLLSIEPLLSRINLRIIFDQESETSSDCLTGKYWTNPRDEEGTQGNKIHMVIIGAESGANARGIIEEDLNLIVNDCLETGTALFVKQMGRVLAKKYNMSDMKGEKIEEFPREEWKVRQYPIQIINHFEKYKEKK